MEASVPAVNTVASSVDALPNGDFYDVGGVLVLPADSMWRNRYGSNYRQFNFSSYYADARYPIKSAKKLAGILSAAGVRYTWDKSASDPIFNTDIIIKVEMVDTEEVAVDYVSVDSAAELAKTKETLQAANLSPLFAIKNRGWYSLYYTWNPTNQIKARVFNLGGISSKPMVLSDMVAKMNNAGYTVLKAGLESAEIEYVGKEIIASYSEKGFKTAEDASRAMKAFRATKEMSRGWVTTIPPTISSVWVAEEYQFTVEYLDLP